MNIKIPLQCFLYFYIPPQDGSIMLTLTSPKQRVMFLMFAAICSQPFSLHTDFHILISVPLSSKDGLHSVMIMSDICRQCSSNLNKINIYLFLKILYNKI